MLVVGLKSSVRIRDWETAIHDRGYMESGIYKETRVTHDRQKHTTDDGGLEPLFWRKPADARERLAVSGVLNKYNVQEGDHEADEDADKRETAGPGGPAALLLKDNGEGSE